MAHRLERSLRHREVEGSIHQLDYEKKKTFLLCCNHEPVRVLPNNNESRCEYYRITMSLGANYNEQQQELRLTIKFQLDLVFFLLVVCEMLDDYRHYLLTTPTDITYRHFLHTP